MAIEVTCECGKAYRVSDDNAGKRFKCRECETLVRVPNANGDETDEDVDLDEDEVGIEPAAKYVPMHRRLWARRRSAKQEFWSSGNLAVCLWLSLAAANQLAADPPSHQPTEAVQQSYREPERPFPKPKRNDQLERLQKQQIEIHDMLEKGQENLKKLDETIKKREQEEADRAKTIAEQKEARFARGSVSRLFLMGVVGLLILVYRTFKNPEH